MWLMRNTVIWLLNSDSGGAGLRVKEDDLLFLTFVRDHNENTVLSAAA